MNCCGMSFGFWRPDATREAFAGERHFGPRHASSAESPIAAVWPEHGQRAVGAFLPRLGGVRDKAAFDEFMSERRTRASQQG